MGSFKVGEAPWEQETQGGFKVGEAPWEQGAAQRDTVLNEEPEGLKGRFLVKNFSANPEGAINYLKKINPDFEIKREQDGEIIAKKTGDSQWGRLDPKGFDLQDVSDLAYDIPAGIAQGVATAGAGIAGAAGGMGIGAIPASMAGSAASGAALEGLRQGIGAFFIDDNLSGSGIGESAVAGAISPLLFGTGASTSGAIKAAGSSAGARKILDAQKGVLGRVYDKSAGAVGPKLASILGGYRPEVIKAASENLPIIQAAKKNPEVAVSLLQEGREKIIGGLKSSLDDTGKSLENLTKELDADGALIPTEGILSPVKDLQEHLKRTGIQSEERKALIKKLENMVEENFTVKTEIRPELTIDQRLAIAAGIPPIDPIPKTIIKKELPERITPSQANEAYFTLKGMAQDSGINLKNIGQMKSVVTPGAMNDMRVARAFNQATKKAKDAVKDAAESQGYGEEYAGLNASYSELKNFQDLFSKATKDEEAYQRFLNKRGSNANFAKQKVSKMIGEDVDELGAKMQAVELFSNPGWEIPAFGNSNTGRTMLASSLGGGAGYLIGKENDGKTFLPTMLGAALGSRAVSPIMIRKYLESNRAIRDLPMNIPGYKTLPYLMMNPTLENKER